MIILVLVVLRTASAMSLMIMYYIGKTGLSSAYIHLGQRSTSTSYTYYVMELWPVIHTVGCSYGHLHMLCDVAMAQHHAI